MDSEKANQFFKKLSRFLVLTLILMLIWNELMPKFFELKQMDYVEALMFHFLINIVHRDRTPKKL